jgi:small multidrug resistance family-3 protein
MTVARSVLLFALAAVLEIGGAWLVWQSIREHRGWLCAAVGVIMYAPRGR